jgi:hypothetical protein
VLWPTRTIDLFFRFYSQVKKYHSLSIVSSVRLHRVQAKMDLRYFLESTVHAGYALAHSQTTAYFDLDRQALGDAKKATGQAHRWIEQDFPSHSAFITDAADLQALMADNDAVLAELHQGALAGSAE